VAPPRVVVTAAGRPLAGRDGARPALRRPRRSAAALVVVAITGARTDQTSCLATFSSMPVAASSTSMLDPPKETSGSGTPVIGSTPTTAPMLTSAWTTIQTVIPPAR
jgi:hypothetical protein